MTTVNRDEDRAIALQDANYNKRLAALGVFPGVQPTAEQRQAISLATAERDAAHAEIRRKAAEVRASIMGGGDDAGFSVKRIE